MRPPQAHRALVGRPQLIADLQVLLIQGIIAPPAGAVATATATSIAAAIAAMRMALLLRRRRKRRRGGHVDAEVLSGRRQRLLQARDGRANVPRLAREHHRAAPTAISAASATTADAATGSHPPHHVAFVLLQRSDEGRRQVADCGGSGRRGARGGVLELQLVLLGLMMMVLVLLGVLLLVLVLWVAASVRLWGVVTIPTTATTSHQARHAAPPIPAHVRLLQYLSTLSRASPSEKPSHFETRHESSGRGSSSGASTLVGGFTISAEEAASSSSGVSSIIIMLRVRAASVSLYTKHKWRNIYR